MKSIYTVFDKKVGTYFPPQYADHVVQLQRSLQELLQEKNNNLAKFPTDFELYELGKWDENTGEILVHDKPIFILNIDSLNQKPETKDTT